MKPVERTPTIVVTGATSGIGRAVAGGLVERGVNVIGVGRSMERCAATEEELADRMPEVKIAFLLADLSMQNQVRELAQTIENQLRSWNRNGLDGLVNNAGTFTFWQTLTAEGFEKQWAVNHLAPFLLTLELLPALRAAPAARVVTVSSGSHYGTDLNWDDLQLSRHYSPLRAYKQSKLANVAFTAELNRRLGQGSRVRAYAADPGLVDTAIGQKAGSSLARWIWSLRRRSGIPAEQSAECIIRLLLDPEVDLAHGLYWKHGQPKEPNPYALEPEIGWRLWEVSATMCGLQDTLEAA